MRNCQSQWKQWELNNKSNKQIGVTPTNSEMRDSRRKQKRKGIREMQCITRRRFFLFFVFCIFRGFSFLLPRSGFCSPAVSVGLKAWNTTIIINICCSLWGNYIHTYIHIVSHRVFVCSLSICDWCAQRACWKMRVAVICICKIQICQIRVVPQKTAGALNMHCGTSIAKHEQTAIDSEIYRLSHWSNAK